MDFSAAPRAEAFFAGGCFWGVEYHMEQQPGVLRADSGYMGGESQAPSYAEVCSGQSGHAEVVRVQYDPSQIDFERLAKLFFEIHDPSQLNRQGPDRGSQYRSALFYTELKQREIAQSLMLQLEKTGLSVVTRLEPAGRFWPAEEHHQDYYARKGGAPYCHSRVKRF